MQIESTLQQITNKHYTNKEIDYFVRTQKPLVLASNTRRIIHKIRKIIGGLNLMYISHVSSNERRKNC